MMKLRKSMTTDLTVTVDGVSRVVTGGGHVVIGTAADCDIVVGSRGAQGVAARHIRIRDERGRWVLYDLGSGSPTSVNAVAVSTTTVLKGSGTIRLGAALNETFVDFSTGRRNGTLTSNKRVFAIVGAVAVVMLATVAVVAAGGDGDESSSAGTAPHGSVGPGPAAVTTLPRTQTSPPTDTSGSNPPDTTVTPDTPEPPDTTGLSNPAGECATAQGTALLGSGKTVGFSLPQVRYLDTDKVEVVGTRAPSTDLWATDLAMSEPYDKPIEIDAASEQEAISQLIGEVDHEWELRNTNPNYLGGLGVLVLVGTPGHYLLVPTGALEVHVVFGPDGTRIGKSGQDQLEGVIAWRKQVQAGCVLSWQQVVAWAQRDTLDSASLDDRCIRTISGVTEGDVANYTMDYRLVPNGEYTIADRPMCVPAGEAEVIMPT